MGLGDRPSPVDEAKEPIFRAPPIVPAFIAIFALVHVGSLFISDLQYDELISNFALIPSHISDPTVGILAKTTSLVTYAFLHGDFTHLIFNSVWFLIFATVVARRIGTARFLLLSLIATLGAALAHLACHWGSTMPVVGASGAISGLMGAAFRFIFINPRESVWPPTLLPLFSRPVLIASAVWVVLNVIFGVTGYSLDGFGRAIAWEAHLGGFFTGLLVLPLFDRRRSWIS
jgi:membrane associated rhomboid family serine protease